VLTGDFLYSRAFQLMVELDSIGVLGVLADTTNVIAEGEVLQLMNCHNPDITESIYDNVIERKTAVLFEAAARCGGLIGQGSSDQIECLSQYGKQLGMAFQLIDDCLDYRADAQTTGKNLGDDLSEGKTTLPLIIAMQRADESGRALLAQAIRSGGREHLDEVIEIIEASEAITYTAQRAESAAKAAMQALDGLSDSPYKSAMLQLATFAVKRAY
jgi:octaprenyl-diphosphate synthase